jgi:hypothetical protein
VVGLQLAGGELPNLENEEVRHEVSMTKRMWLVQVIVAEMPRLGGLMDQGNW